ncbi:MAG TPA: cytochrome c oxidase subunit 3 [Thermoleophilaceae bacterium]
MSDATETSAVARPIVQSGRTASGWWGAALFIAAEATLFGTLIATYFYLRFETTRWPPPGVPKPELALPLILTAILVATTVPVLKAVQAARAGRVGLAWLLVFAALVVQAAYFGIQVHEFQSDLAKFTPSGSAYGSIYFTLVGAHHAHVAIGLLLDLWILGKLTRGLTSYRLTGLRVVALYWCFVSIAGVAIVLTQVSPSL